MATKNVDTLEPETVAMLSYVVKCSLLMGIKTVHLIVERLWLGLSVNAWPLRSRAERKSSQSDLCEGRQGGAIQNPRKT